MEQTKNQRYHELIGAEGATQPGWRRRVYSQASCRTVARSVCAAEPLSSRGEIDDIYRSGRGAQPILHLRRPLSRRWGQISEG